MNEKIIELYHNTPKEKEGTLRQRTICLLEQTKKRYCQAIREKRKLVARSELRNIEAIRTNLYILNRDLRIDTFSE